MKLYRKAGFTTVCETDEEYIMIIDITIRISILAFDYKKEYREFYMPKNKPGIIEIPKMNYIAVRGKGNPKALLS